MIRPARHMDAFAMVDILVERQKDSRYAGIVDVDQPYARKMLSAMIQRHGGTNDGATFVKVSDNDDGLVDAFVTGSLDRVYGVGSRLCATSGYLIGRKSCSTRVLLELLDGFIGWAASNPKVFEIVTNYSDALPDSAHFQSYFTRHGFLECGREFRRTNPHSIEELAA